MNSWSQVKIKDIAKPGRENFIDGDWVEAPHIKDKGVRLIQTGNIGIGKFIDRSKKYISEESFKELNCKDVLPHDVLICRLAEPVGRSCIVPEDLGKSITSVDVVIFRVNEEKYDKEFIVQSINTQEFLGKCLEVSAGSTRTRISRTNLGQLEISCPDKKTQEKIAKILTTIDQLIEKTQVLIDKHSAIKQGMMADLFTRGIDLATGQLRPPIEQAPHLYRETELGLIPCDWKVYRLGDVAIKIADRDHFTPNYTEHGVPIISPKDFNHLDKIEFTKCKYISIEEHQKNRKKTDLEVDDIVFTRIGAGLGKACLVTEDMPEFSILHSAAMIRPNVDYITPDFLLYFLKHDLLQRQISIEVQSIGVPDLGLDKINNFKTLIPDINEQNFINKKLNTINAQIEALYSSLYKSKTLKAGLMQDLLTGQVSINNSE